MHKLYYENCHIFSIFTIFHIDEKIKDSYITQSYKILISRKFDSIKSTF